MSDTSAEARRVQDDIHRRMKPESRSLLAIELSDRMMEIATEGIRARHPDYDDDQARWALWRIRVGDRLFRAAWPQAPLLDP